MMNALIVTICLGSSLALAVGQPAYIAEFYAAKKLESSNRKAAAELMVQCFRHAAEMENADYVTAAGVNATQMIYAEGKVIEAGNLAREVIYTLDPLVDRGSPFNDAVRRVQLFGLAERGLRAQGKLGAAWQMNRAAAETLRTKKVSVKADGPSITVAEVIPLSGFMRSQGWRLIERESELMDLAGRTLEARALLDDAANYILGNWADLDSSERFYAFKLLGSKSMLLDFLGYNKESIDLQEKLLELAEGHPDIIVSTRLNVRLNLLRNLSQWNGPSEEILAEAKAVGVQLKGGVSYRGVERLLAKMELDLRDSKEAARVLEIDAKTDADLGFLFDAVYAKRDSLVQRAKSGDPQLDGEFLSLLQKMRSQGNKRGEPDLYREYGEYLLARNRPAEAVRMISEALRLTRLFRLDLHEPALLASLFNARFSAGDVSGARVVLAELEAFLKSHPDLPPARRVAAEVSRAMALARLGDRAGASAALALARGHAGDLPDYQKRWLSAEAEAGILKSAPASGVEIAAAPAVFKVNPLEVVSAIPIGATARTHFSVFNFTGSQAKGQWVVRGPGKSIEALKESVVFTPSPAISTVKIPAIIEAGREVVLPVSVTFIAGVDGAKFEISWENSTGVASPASTWEIKWDAGSESSRVVDASLIETNPFDSISLFHEVAVPPEEKDGVLFRMRSATPLRVEYYESGSNQLMAIDANGNGDFEEAGDLHIRSRAGISGALVAAPGRGGFRTIEVRLFSADGNPVAPDVDGRILEVEVYRDGKWVKEAENVLR